MLKHIVFSVLFLLTFNTFSCAGMFNYVDEKKAEIVNNHYFDIKTVVDENLYTVWVVICKVYQDGKVRNVQYMPIALFPGAPLKTIRYRIDGFNFSLDEFKYIRTFGYGFSRNGGSALTPAVRIHFRDGTVMKFGKKNNSSFVNFFLRSKFKYLHKTEVSLGGKTKQRIKIESLSDHWKILGYAATIENILELVRDLEKIGSVHCQVIPSLYAIPNDSNGASTTYRKNKPYRVTIKTKTDDIHLLSYPTNWQRGTQYISIDGFSSPFSKDYLQKRGVESVENGKICYYPKINTVEGFSYVEEEDW